MSDQTDFKDEDLNEKFKILLDEDTFCFRAHFLKLYGDSND